MKKKVGLILVLISIVALVFSTAAAPMDGKIVSFVGSHFIPGKGVVFIFEVSGITQADLNAASSPVGSVDCNFKDDGNVACTVKHANQYAGQSIPFNLAGYGFSVSVPGNFTCYGSISTYVDGSIEFLPYDAGWTRQDELPWAATGLEQGWLVSHDNCVKSPIEYKFITP